jgi:hypothetical protein
VIKELVGAVSAVRLAPSMDVASVFHRLFFHQPK